MKQFFIPLAASLALLSTTGCANMTPEERAALGGAIVGGLAVAGAVAASAPRYYAPPPPVYVAPRVPINTTCRRWGNTVNCSSW